MIREREGTRMKSSGIGGQAVLEGIMMKNQDEYAVAVRTPNNEIIIQKNKYVSITKRYKVLRVPIIRGVANFLESMVIGTKTLTYSSSFFEDEEEDNKKKDNAGKKNTKGADSKDSKANEKEKTGEGLMMALTICTSIILAVGIFMLLPFFLGNLLAGVIESSVWLSVVEGVIRIAIFIAYVGLISQMKDIKRVFMYHGAEHKTINCIENGLELTVDNVRWQSKEHKRCGTSFLLIVMIVSVIFFIFIDVDSIWLRVLYRILLVPVIAGISYEFIRLAGRSDSKLVQVLSKPGLLVQGLTTREPDDDMIEVAIKSVEAVFDWRTYLKENADQWKGSKKGAVLEEKNEVEAEVLAASLEASGEENSFESKVSYEEDEEDDDILRALDRFFDTPNAKILEQDKED
ncbi:Uncharacterized conserved protein YqhQ [Anaerosporobacter mobilis DSM 15930]|uniref:Uncharacterized conserved protein YqhQ n=1 Tax=Anaerosporobacter mobilis DSM 15930 TaxID=1120996 RepID=A0A1M7L5W4_9FIRM|nr:DUF1385 domain-containing protein [Anaerosporobacter mobilis]SHM73498.1 Uncharacterized conserved protein YqhQ [Anaerosporobacter mobilis DSM 15930]